MLKSALFPVRDAVAALIRADAPFVRAETKVYFNDTLDHSISLIEMVETQRDMLTGLIDMHLSLCAGPHQRDHLVPDDRLGDLHPADLPGRRLGHEFRPFGVTLEHAGAPGRLMAIRWRSASWRWSPRSLVAYFRWKKWL